MKTYRMNAVMAGALYFLGTVFGVLGGIVGGEVLSSVISGQPLAGGDVLSLVAENSPRLTAGAFLTLMMGISLVAMTIFLYPIFKKDSEELAAGLLLFRGALEGTGYILATLGILALVTLSSEFIATGADSAALQSVGDFLYQFQARISPVNSLMFSIGATFLYVSFYRTRLIPRWLSIWGFIGVAGTIAYALLNFFHMDSGIGFWLQMVIAPQEIVMGLWLVIKGFNLDAVKKLDEVQVSSSLSEKAKQTVALQS